tara:strand:- start:1927 stop:2175 length:249 start_codon:yes stop_codon:yes gene_type:complete
VAGPDGLVRTRKAEDDLSIMVAVALAGPTGDELMKYIRAITIEQVAGPEITDHHLRHLEGMRYLCAILERRRETGKELRRGK